MVSQRRRVVERGAISRARLICPERVQCLGHLSGPVLYCTQGNRMIRRISQPLSEAEQNEVLENKLRWLLEACEREASLPHRILVFGSAARGELREDSDIDIALVFADEQTMGKARKAVARSPRTDLWPVDLLYFTQEEFRTKAETGGVCMLIRDEGRVLWEAA